MKLGKNISYMVLYEWAQLHMNMIKNIHFPFDITEIIEKTIT